MFILYIVVFLLSFNLSSINGVTKSENKIFIDEKQEFHLLRNEHYLHLKTSDNVDIFNLFFSFPQSYQFQVPIFLQIYNDTTKKLINYKIENDTFEPNLLINFTISSIKKEEVLLLHFTCWVLVKNHKFDDLPNYVEMPKKEDLPENSKKWIASTKVVQVENFLIKRKARQLRGFSDNIIRYAGRIAPFIKNHRYLFFVLGYKTGLLFSQDAVTTLLINGENVGRSHLACALLRYYNIPARVLLVNNDQGFWTQMHYMVEYFCPGYGWVLIETTGGKTPYETKRQVVNRVCYPEDENDTKWDFIFPFMKGEERWFWIDEDNVYSYFVDCDEGSKSQMFSEAITYTDFQTANDTIALTKNVFYYYHYFLRMNLHEENLLHFQNATNYQIRALNILIDTNIIENYLYYMNLSYEEYQLIEL
jgi:hypothetical protein